MAIFVSTKTMASAFTSSQECEEVEIEIFWASTATKNEKQATKNTQTQNTAQQKTKLKILWVSQQMSSPCKTKVRLVPGHGRKRRLNTCWQRHMRHSHRVCSRMSCFGEMWKHGSASVPFLDPAPWNKHHSRFDCIKVLHLFFWRVLTGRSRPKHVKRTRKHLQTLSSYSTLHTALHSSSQGFSKGVLGHIPPCPAKEVKENTLQKGRSLPSSNPKDRITKNFTTDRY